MNGSDADIEVMNFSGGTEYCSGNTSPCDSPSVFDHIKVDRDYFNDREKYGYAPLIYPHPVAIGDMSAIDGDVNNDGWVDIKDIQACINHMSDENVWADADVNDDGKINEKDIGEVINIIMDSFSP